MKMKSHRPLLINGTPQTEFETTAQHGKELIAAKLAVEVSEQSDPVVEQPVIEPPAEPVVDPVADPVEPATSAAEQPARKKK